MEFAIELCTALALESVKMVMMMNLLVSIMQRQCTAPGRVVLMALHNAVSPSLPIAFTRQNSGSCPNS